MAPDFQNDIIDALIHRIRTQPTSLISDVGNTIFENTPRNSVLRKLVIDEAIYHGKDNFSTEASLREINTEVLDALTAKLWSVREVRVGSNEAPYNRDLCRAYHVHRAGTFRCGRADSQPLAANQN